MKLRMAFILLKAFESASATQVLAQDADAAQGIQDLRDQLRKVHDKEAKPRIRPDQVNSDLNPENIERYLNAVSATRLEELRESRRRQWE